MKPILKIFAAFLAIFALMVMAMSLYGIVVLLEKRLLKWRKTN